MPPGPPPRVNFRYEKVPPPKSIADVPRYLKELCGGFFSRLAYIFRLVWKTGPWILFVMLAISLLQGITPVIGSKISQHVLNEMQSSYGNFSGALGDFLRSPVFFLLIFLFSYNILTSLVNILKNAVSRISGELVVRTVKLEIMNKAKELDLQSFDLPAFYEKLENANREAGNRPVQILSSTFSVVSAIITLISYVIILASVLWWAALVIVAVSIPSAIINFYYRRKNFEYMRRRSHDRRQMSYYSDLLVNKDLAKEIRIFDLSDTFIGRYRTVFDKYFSGIRTLILRENVWHVIIIVVSSVVNCCFYAYFAYLVISGRQMIGDYTLYTGALIAVAGQVSSLIGISATIYEGTLFIDNLTSFLREDRTIVPVLPPERAAEGPRSVTRGVPHTIVFEHVSFSYPGTECRVLDDINLTIRPGETLVLVGLCFLLLARGVPFSIRLLLKGPVFAVFLALGIIWSGLNVYIPKFALNSLSMIGNASIPLNLIMFGCLLADFWGFSNINYKVLSVAVLIRMFIMPAVFIAAAYILPIDHALKTVLVFEAVAPCGVTAAVLAKHFGGNPQMSVQITVATSLLALLVLPLWIVFGFKLLAL